MAFRARGESGEILIGSVRKLAARLGRWRLDDGVLEASVVWCDACHVLEGRGVFRARFGARWLELPVVGDLASGQLHIEHGRR